MADEEARLHTRQIGHRTNLACTDCEGTAFEIVLFLDDPFWKLICNDCGEEYEVSYAVNEVMAKEQG